ncbi:MAG: FMN-binding protein [Prevotella sp.]|nr:FMN-binding protein [Prevotella sp.]
MAKKLNTNSNSYIIIYSIVLVVIVAFCLAFVYSSLKEKQEKNVALDVKKQVLAALDIREFADDADAEAQYKNIVIMTDTVDAETNSIIYICKHNGEDRYILSVRGMGLWGPIWGYVALNADKQTVYGAYFNHDSETAGLGAEIKDSKKWQDQFKGKKAIIDSEVKLGVKKPTDIKPEEKDFTVDGVTGATLTCNGVDLMFKESLKKYSDFLNLNK